MGQAADRLRDDETALAYFRLYLSESPNPERRVEVEARIAAIERARVLRPIAEAEPDVPPEAAPGEPAPPLPVSTAGDAEQFELVAQWWFWTIVGAVAIGAGAGIGIAATADTSPEHRTGDLGGVIFTLRGTLP